MASCASPRPGTQVGRAASCRSASSAALCRRQPPPAAASRHSPLHHRPPVPAKQCLLPLVQAMRLRSSPSPRCWTNPAPRSASGQSKYRTCAARCGHSTACCKRASATHARRTCLLPQRLHRTASIARPCAGGGTAGAAGHPECGQPGRRVRGRYTRAPGERAAVGYGAGCGGGRQAAVTSRARERTAGLCCVVNPAPARPPGAGALQRRRAAGAAGRRPRRRQGAALL